MTSKRGLCRRFYSLPENPNRAPRNKFSGACRKREDIAKLIKYVDDNVIGKNITFSGPYGRRKVVYCDYGSSGRSLQFIEDYIVKEVLSGCGDTHNASSITSLQSTIFRHEAIGIVRTCVNASDDDEIFFASHGCSGAIRQLTEVFDFQGPPVIFVGPCEHQYTLQPWRQLGAKVVRISESKEGFLDLDDLETQLLAHQGWTGQLIGFFSAASSVTGILADDVATTLLLHQHGALAIWDYGTAASFVTLDMNPTLPGVGERAVHKDAIIFSAHKLLGGVQTTGVLIVKKRLLKCTVPSLCRNEVRVCETCSCKENQRCPQECESAEGESATDLVEVVRTGLVMQLKEAVGVPAIMSRAEKITRMVLAHIRNIPELILLGNCSHSLRRLPTFSFIVRHPRGTFLHHNFVCSVLNDIFGIQANSASVCSGPYSQVLMGIDNKMAEEYEKILLEKKKDENDEEYSSYEILRPGFSRISLPYCINDADLGFILEALKMVATEAWKLLPQYVMIPETAEWRHHGNSAFRDKKWLSSIRYVEGRMVIHERKVSAQGTSPVDYAECLHIARSIFNKARKMAQRYPQALQKYVFSDEVEPLRWFMLPSEAHNLLLGNSQNVKLKVPFDPVRYTGCKGDPLVVNIANMFSSESRTRVSSEKNSSSTSSDSMTSIVNGQSESCASNCKPHLTNKMVNPAQNNLSPKTPNHLLPERQNSFSSDISNSEYLYDIPNYQQNSSFGNMCSYSGMCQSPVRNYPDNLCYSPQPLTSPVMNHTDVTSHFAMQQQTNYGTIPQNYGNYACGNNVNFDNNYNYPYLEKWPKVMNSTLNYSSLDRGTGKAENQYQGNKVHFALGPSENSTRQRCNSLGSSLILNPKSRASLGISCRSLTDGETSLNLSECSLSSNEDIHAYVTEVTKELATEIKSEIREVISKVEDVLSEAVDNDTSNYSLLEHRGSRSLEPRSMSEKLERTNSLPSATASDIAQYLMGVSKEMAEEMKSEIRGLVSSVVSPESSPMPDKKSKKVTIDPSEEGKVVVKDSYLRKCEMTKFEDISQSRDSGINMSYSEMGTEQKGKEKEVVDEKFVGSSGGRDRSESLDSFQENEKTVRCRSESLDSLQGNDDSDAVGKCEFLKRKVSRASKKTDKVKSHFSGESSNDEGMNSDGYPQPKWFCPSKAVWKPTIEAIQEFDMVKNGDKILICLSTGRHSLSLMHALHQYRFYASSRGIHFELGVVIGHSKCDQDDNSLGAYLDALGITCFDEEPPDEDQEDALICTSCSRIKRTHLFTIAKNKEFNVIAFDHHLDDFAESFLTSAFYNGRLSSMRAHYLNAAKDIRVIRPFVYVREKALRQFAESRNLPAISQNCSVCFTAPKERHRSKQLLAQQESAFPRLFASLKTALHPLISSRHAEDQPYQYIADSDEAQPNVKRN